MESNSLSARTGISNETSQSVIELPLPWVLLPRPLSQLETKHNQFAGEAGQASTQHNLCRLCQADTVHTLWLSSGNDPEGSSAVAFLKTTALLLISANAW